MRTGRDRRDMRDRILSEPEERQPVHRNGVGCVGSDVSVVTPAESHGCCLHRPLESGLP
jgi:hypothetical protein